MAAISGQITLACLVQPDWEERYLAEVSPFCQSVTPVHLNRYEPYKNIASSLFTRAPLSVAYSDSVEFKRLVGELVSQKGFDLIHTEFVRATPTTLHLDGAPKVYDAVDSLTLTYRRTISASYVSAKQRLIALIEWVKMRNYEAWVLERYDRTIISSPADKQALLSNGTNIEVIPNGVDLDYFTPHTGPRGSATIVFLGKMSYYVNVASVLWFYKQVFPLIRCQFPEARLIIVGSNPVAAITSLRNDPAVEVTGTVPDVRPYLAQATLSICPMVSGSGIQNKMLEAMAMGTPWVLTAKGRLERSTSTAVSNSTRAPNFSACF